MTQNHANHNQENAAGKKNIKGRDKPAPSSAAKEQRDLKLSDNRDHPEQYPTDKESLFDMHDSGLNVDPLPMEDIKIEAGEEKEKHKTKNTSSSERKYKSGFEKKD